MENNKSEDLSLDRILNQLEQEVAAPNFKEWFRGQITSWLSEVTTKKNGHYPGNAKLFPLQPVDHWNVPQQCAMLGAWHDVRFKGQRLFPMPDTPEGNADGFIPLLSVLQGMAWEGLLRGVRKGEPETWEVELEAMLRNVKAAWKAAPRPRGGAGKKRGRPAVSDAEQCDEEQLADKQKRAKDSKANKRHKPDFAKENGIALKGGDEFLDRFEAIVRNFIVAWEATSKTRGGTGKKRGRLKADCNTVQRGAKRVAKKQAGNQGMSPTQANEKAMKFAKKDSQFVKKTQREWAKLIGCSEGTVAKTTMWTETMKKTGRGQKGKSAKLPTVTLTRGLEATVGKGEKHEVLNQIIAEQKADMEPSPLDQEGRNPINYRD